MTRWTVGIIGLLCAWWVSCSAPNHQKDDDVLFELLNASKTGLKFQNTLEANPVQNVFNYMYFYNGGGVCAADFNADGLTDLFFTSNQHDNALYLNRGGFKFEDVTRDAGITRGLGWSTGAAAADVNGDGLTDLYVSQVSGIMGLGGTNQLFLNMGTSSDGMPRFEERARDFGLDLTGLCTQAGFFDYDQDGDLDMFQLRHSIHDNSTYGPRNQMLTEVSDRSGDQLLRNDGGTFSDVSQKAGILSSVVGYGLGLAFGDVNLDGLPDIYIGNDFHENDYLYLNQGDGTFSEVLTEAIQHTSRFSMGVDIGDLNNDMWPEIISLDMHPEDPQVLKSAMGEDAYNVFQFKLSYGYSVQFARNALQRNNGDGTFSEIAQMAGVYATDWSWAPLFVDFDNDGKKDLFISNGIPKRMNDIDYIKFISAAEIQKRLESEHIEKEDLELAEKMPEIKLYDKFFRNTGDGFYLKDLTGAVKGHSPSYSNGAVYEDFDNDGDVDIVTNAIGDFPFVYRNLWRGQESDSLNAWVQFRFVGPPGNSAGIGARIVVFKRNDEVLYSEFFPTRGFQSSMADRLHMGLGSLSAIDSIIVIWPDNSYQRLSQSEINKLAVVNWQAGLPALPSGQLKRWAGMKRPYDVQVSHQNPDFQHAENQFIEFNREPLMPFMVSREGPALAIADVNGDGLDDVFLGGAKLQPSQVFWQSADGKLVARRDVEIASDSLSEDVDAAFADVDGDGDQDLLVITGGNEFQGQAIPRQPRLYINDGQGNWTRKQNAFQGVYLTGSCIEVNDFTGDGLPDVFIGARAEPREYGAIPASFLLENIGDGIFRDVTGAYAPQLRNAGLVTDAIWADIDSDGDSDLVVVAEWSPVLIFRREGAQFTKEELAGTEGLWKSVVSWDYNGDGTLDLLAGNIGENSKLKPTPSHPVRMLVEDFDENGSREQIVLYNLGGEEIMFANYMELVGQIPELKRKWLSATDFANAPHTDILPADKLSTATEFRMTTGSHSLFINDGTGAFQARPLPEALQISPINAIALADLDSDGRQEAILGGNFYPLNVELGRYDASYGAIWDPDTDLTQGLGVTGEIRKLAPIRIGDDIQWIGTRNNDRSVLIRIENKQ